MFKKILLMIILTVAIIGCSARDIALWKESDRRASERGVRCFKRANGDYYCKDRYGNIVY